MAAQSREDRDCPLSPEADVAGAREVGVCHVVPDQLCPRRVAKPLSRPELRLPVCEWEP